MEKPNIEEYDYRSPIVNHFADYDLDTACDLLWNISDDEAVDMGYDSGDDMWDVVMKEYMLTENENALPPFF